MSTVPFTKTLYTPPPYLAITLTIAGKYISKNSYLKLKYSLLRRVEVKELLKNQEKETAEGYASTKHSTRQTGV